MNKVYIVLVSTYYNEEYWDVATEVDSVFATKEKAEEYIKSIPNIAWDEETLSWKVGDEDKNPYEVKFYDIQEEEVND